MSEPILNERYWRQRLEAAPPDALHHAIFRCPTQRWRAIEERHRLLLSQYTRPDDSILDAGCGWGRLLDLMPEGWRGTYLGIDLSPDFISLARSLHPQRLFLVGDLRRMPEIRGQYDWSILISIRPMIRRNLGEPAWQEIDAELRRLSKKRLFLEYDDADSGSVEE